MYLTPAERDIMGALERNTLERGLFIAEIVIASGRARGTVSALLSKLQALGLIASRASAPGRQAYRVYWLTCAGYEAYAASSAETDHPQPGTSDTDEPPSPTT
jgi:DNA-binding IclR family transcriptional regulator